VPVPFVFKPRAVLVAGLMGTATREVLWKRYAEQITRRGPARLVTRVAAGKATNHRRKPGADLHVISYGWKMVQDKAADHARASAWLSAREIRSRSFFGGELTVLRVLAHTVCHEFAHLRQSVAGERSYRSVHNRAFYRLLDEIHADGAAELVLDHLTAAVRGAGLDLEWTAEEAARVPVPPHERPRPEGLSSFQPGDRVSFEIRGRRVVGRVRRVNLRTVTVVPEVGRADVRWWRVSPTLLTKLG
jgi:hypothetical protein